MGIPTTAEGIGRSIVEVLRSHRVFDEQHSFCTGGQIFLVGGDATGGHGGEVTLSAGDGGMASFGEPPATDIIGVLQESML